MDNTLVFKNIKEYAPSCVVVGRTVITGVMFSESPIVVVGNVDVYASSSGLYLPSADWRQIEPEVRGMHVEYGNLRVH